MKAGYFGLLLLAACAAPPAVKPLPHGFIAGAAPGAVMNLCPTKEDLCPGGVELKDHNGAKPPPKITHSLSVRYCDKPIVVWVMLENGNLARFDAEDPITDEFKTPEDFKAWLEAVPNDVYDLPCVGADNQRPIDSWPGGNDKGKAK